MRRYTVLVLVLVAVVAAAGGVYAYVNHQADVARVQQGQTWQVSLDSNPSTGFSWTAEYDEALLELVDLAFEESASGMIGAPGKETLTFRALQTGTAKMTLKYQRPWEGQPEQILTYTLRIFR